MRFEVVEGDMQELFVKVKGDVESNASGYFKEIYQVPWSLRKERSFLVFQIAEMLELLGNYTLFTMSYEDYLSVKSFYNSIGKKWLVNTPGSKLYYVRPGNLSTTCRGMSLDGFVADKEAFNSKDLEDVMNSVRACQAKSKKSIEIYFSQNIK